MWLLIALACHDHPVESDTGAAPSGPADADGDGAPEGVDCDDSDAWIHPGAAEECDGVDQDCDGVVDEDAIVERVAFLDADSDGYGAPTDYTLACIPSDGYVTTGGDCEDDDPTVHPAAAEICDDGLDQDCDGASDEGCSAPGPRDLSTSDADAWWSGSGMRAVASAVAAADLDGDGADDLLVNAYEDATGQGIMAVAYGGARAGAYLLDDEPYWVMASTSTGTANPAGLGDLDGDGYDEVGIVDAYQTGCIVYGGPTRIASGAALADDADAFFRDTYRIFRAGDLDGDGLGEAGAFSYSALALVGGSASRLSGAVSLATAPTWEGTADESLGGMVAGDFDGDGLDDLAIAANYDRDASSHTVRQTWYVWPGTSGGYTGVQVVTDAPGGVQITTESAAVGYNEGNAGDVNGDGFDDLAATNDGSWVFFGGAAGFEGVRSASEADLSLHRGIWAGPYLGDLTGDGVADLVVAALDFNDPYDSAGAVFGLPGGPELTGRWYPSDMPLLIRGEAAGTQAGRELVMEPADLDGDGVEDLLFGSPVVDAFGGRAWAFFRPFDG